MIPINIARMLWYLEERKGIIIQTTEQATLLGKPYKVIKGTIRPKPDYDDAWLLALSLEAKIVFDIGCNKGQAALIVLQSSQVKEIVLVDPEPTALAIAAKNLINNGFSIKARFACAFASDCPDETVTFFSLPGGEASSIYAEHAISASQLNSEKKVTTTTIDQLVAKFQVKPDLIKIDTEGAEYFVLNGAIKLAKERHARFLVEMHSNPKLCMRKNAEQILDWCRLTGYKAWYLKEKIELTSAEIISKRGRCHLLLLPDEHNFPESLIHLEQGAPLNKAINTQTKRQK